MEFHDIYLLTLEGHQGLGALHVCCLFDFLTSLMGKPGHALLPENEEDEKAQEIETN